MKKILVAVDFSDATGAVVEAAGSLAGAFGAELVMLHVAAPEPEFIGYDPGPQSVRDSVARELVAEHHGLQDWENKLKAKDLQVTALVVQGYPVEKILDEVERRGADLVVIGSHGHGALHNLLVGSVTEGVMRKASCPVLVVPFRSA